MRPEHGPRRSIALHVGPGTAMLVFYVATAPWFMELGFPPVFASLVSIPAILVPWMLDYLAQLILWGALVFAVSEQFLAPAAAARAI